MSDLPIGDSLNFEAELRRGRASEDSGRLREAYEIYEGLHKAGYQSVDLYRRFGAVTWDLQQPEEAVKLLWEGFKHFPGDHKLRSDLCEMLIGLDRRDEAEQLLQEGLDSDPSAEDLMVQRALLLRLSGKSAEARQLISKALEAGSANLGAHQAMASFAWHDGELGLAEHHMTLVRKADQTLADPHVILGQSLFAQGRAGEIGQLPLVQDKGQRFAEMIIRAVHAWQIGHIEACEAILQKANTFQVFGKEAANWPLFGSLFQIIACLVDYGSKHSQTYQSEADGVAYVVGDSHVLPHHLLVAREGDQQVRLNARHILAFKAWHLVRDRGGPERGAFEQILNRLPEQSSIYLSMGSTDCRFKGATFDYLKANPQLEAGQVFSDLLGKALDRAMELCRVRGHRLGLILPPSPNIAFRRLPSYDRDRYITLVDSFSQALRHQCAMRGLPLVDLFSQSFDPQSGLRKDAYLTLGLLRPDACKAAFDALHQG